MPPMNLSNIILPALTSPHDIVISSDSMISSITPRPPPSTQSPPSLLLPTLCHPHIHLDKPYLLTCNHQNPPNSEHSSLPDYSDLAPQAGTFQEALANTAAAKTRFTTEDLYLRGSQLLATSYTQGVTSARCFVEVDHVTQLKTLEVGLRLKEAFSASRPGHERGLLDVQLCVFAQDPVFSSEHGKENRRLIEEALEKYAGRGVDVLGSTPYVESSRSASLENIYWAIITALKYDLHLDLHLDYSLDIAPASALVWIVIHLLLEHKWPCHQSGSRRRTVCIGHCTALTNFTNLELNILEAQINDDNLPVYFVSLPTSDLYMMGRSSDPPKFSPSDHDGLENNQKRMNRPRGTINPISLQQDHGLNAALGVNNVGNAFTPFGTGDPLALACWGVGLHHAGTEEHAKMLYECVSSGARRAIGLEDEDEGDGLMKKIKEGGQVPKYGWLLVKNEEFVGCPGQLGMKVPARQRRGVRDVVWDPPETRLREVIR